MTAPDVCVENPHRAVERAALRTLCVANGAWCSTNKWTGDTDDYCANSLSESGTSDCTSGGAECSNGWYGVGCNSAGRVTRMYVGASGVYRCATTQLTHRACRNLFSQGLTGPAPPSFSLLTALTYLCVIRLACCVVCALAAVLLWVLLL